MPKPPHVRVVRAWPPPRGSSALDRRKPPGRPLSGRLLRTRSTTPAAYGPDGGSIRLALSAVVAPCGRRRWTRAPGSQGGAEVDLREVRAPGRSAVLRRDGPRPLLARELV